MNSDAGASGPVGSGVRRNPFFRTFGRRGRLPVSLVPEDEPIDIPAVGEGQPGGDEVENVGREMLLVTPQGTVVPVKETGDEGNDGNESTGEPTVDSEEGGLANQPRPGPVTINQEWLDRVIAGGHPLIRYDNRHPENIEGSIQDQMRGLDQTQIDEIRRTFGNNIPVTVAAEMLRRARGEFGTSLRLRQLSTGLMVNAEGNVYNPLMQARLDQINQTTARITMQSQVINQGDQFYERFINDEEAYVRFLRDTFSTMSEEDRQMYAESIARLWQTRNAIYEQGRDLEETGQGTEEVLNSLKEQRLKVHRAILKLEDQMTYDDNRRRLMDTSLEAYRQYKKRKLNPNTSVLDLETASLDQLYQFLAELNNTQASVLESIVETEMNLHPERADQIRSSAQYGIQTEYIRRNCQSIMAFLSTLATQLGGVEDATGLSRHIREVTMQLLQEYDGKENFNIGNMIQTIASKYLEAFIANASGNNNIVQRYKKLQEGVMEFTDALGYLRKILDDPNMSEEQIQHNIGEFRSRFRHDSLRVTGGKIAQKFLRDEIERKLSRGKKLNENLVSLAERLKAISEKESEKYRQIIQARKTGGVAAFSDSESEAADTVDAEVREEERLILENAELQEEIKRLRSRLEFEDAYEILKGICEDTISEVSALNLLTQGIDESVEGSAAERAKRTLTKIRAIREYLENALMIEGAGSVEGLNGIIEDLRNELTGLNFQLRVTEEDLERHVQRLVATQINEREIYNENMQLRNALAEAQELLREAGMRYDVSQQQGNDVYTLLQTTQQELLELRNQNVELSQRAEAMGRQLMNLTRELDVRREQLDMAKRDLTDAVEGADEANSMLTATTRNLQNIIRSNMELIDSTANAFVESAVAFYQSAAGVLKRVNPSTITYDSLRPFLTSSQSVDVLASIFHRNTQGPQKDIVIYMLAKRYREAKDNYDMSTDNGSISNFVRFLYGALSEQDRAEYNVHDLLHALAVQNEMDYMPDGYWEMFETAATMNPNTMIYFYNMASMAMLVDIVNDPKAFAYIESGSITDTLINVFNSEEMQGAGVRLLMDGLAMRVARDHVTAGHRIGGTRLREQTASEDDLLERNADDVEYARDTFKRARRLLYHAFTQFMGYTGGHPGDIFNMPVNEGILNVLLFDDTQRTGGPPAMYNALLAQVNDGRDVIDDTDLSRLALQASEYYVDQLVIDSRFDTMFTGTERDAFNNVYLGIIQAYMEQYNTAGIGRERSGNELVGPMIQQHLNPGNQARALMPPDQTRSITDFEDVE